MAWTYQNNISFVCVCVHACMHSEGQIFAYDGMHPQAIFHFQFIK